MTEDLNQQESDYDISQADLDALSALDEERALKPTALVAVAGDVSMLHALFARTITPEDVVLTDFVTHVMGPLGDIFGAMSAKGGSFYQKQQAEFEGGRTNMRAPEDYRRDQTMRAHILNGILPAVRVARQLTVWGAPRMRDWTEQAERLAIAGYVLHDYTKIDAVKDAFATAGFGTFTNPTPGKLPLIERLILEWCETLGLDAFLQPVGGAATLLHDLIYVAQNTQRKKETALLPNLLPNKATNNDVYTLAADTSRLADLVAYVARTPRHMVAHEGIRKALEALAFDPGVPGSVAARLTYHHIAENRGVLLNFIHDAVQTAMLADTDLRIALLYAPSGIVYLQRYDAPPLPDLGALIAHTVTDIRQKAGSRLVATGKGAKVSKDGLRIDDSYNDYLDLRQFIAASYQLAERVRSNAPQYMEKLVTLGFPHSDLLPDYSREKTDTRLRQMAEWASLVEIQIEDRFPAFAPTFTEHLLTAWGLNDLSEVFAEVRAHKPEREGTGIRYYWFWAAAYALDRTPMRPDQVLLLLENLAGQLADALPDVLPETAQINPTKWIDLGDYLQRVLTLGGSRAQVIKPSNEVNRYINAKKPRGGGAVCAMCGDDYAVTVPKESVVAFQPGVYTSRVKIKSPNNVRSLCSICALEQLLRQLFVNNLDTGGNVEGQRVRYLWFYPSYFFTPETLRVVRQMYGALSDMRLSDKDLISTLRTADLESGSIALWTRLTPFLLASPDDAPAKRVLRFGESVGGTTFMIGLRNFDPKTDIESWVLPVFVGLVLAINLDLKVVISEGSVPVITESDELPETIWFDGIHAAVRAVIDIGRDGTPDRLHVDEVVRALCRLSAAYLIHLDSEYAPPDENWRRFPPIAHSLAESPLYVFHYLLKQEREHPDTKPLTRGKVQRYLAYARVLAGNKEDHLMTIARELVEAYRGFYRADNFKNSNSILRPLNVVADALLSASATPAYRDRDMLLEIANGELYKFMDRVSKGLAEGRFPKGITVEQRAEAMRTFCAIFVDGLFVNTYNSDASSLRGKPINLLKNACEVIYREMQFAEWSARGRDPEEVDDDVDDTP